MMKKLLLLINCVFVVLFLIPKSSLSQSNCSLIINSQTNNNCNGDFDGSVVLTGSGGTGFYSYSLGFLNQFTGTLIPFTNTGTGFYATPINLTNLPANCYTATITDSLGCADTTTICITQPDILSSSLSVQDVNQCYGDSNSSALITISGGTQPYFVNGNQISSDTISFNNLGAGPYTFAITDANSCSLDTNSVTSYTITQPNILSVAGTITSNFNGQDISCFGASDGEITANVTSGSPPYEYSIDNTNWTSNPIFSGLSSGTHTIYYRDANLCLNNETFILNDPIDLSGTININTPISCFGDNNAQIQFIVDPTLIGTQGPGANPYLYSSNGGGFANSSIFNNLSGDSTYVITVRDNNNCTYSDSVFVTEPDDITYSSDVTSTNIYNGFGVSCNGSVDGEITFSNLSGGTPNFSFSIDNGNSFHSNSIFNNSTGFNISAGTYTVLVRDAAGCETSTIALPVSEPSIFTANAIPTLGSNNTMGTTCFNECDASLTVNVSNDPALPYQFSYSLSGLPNQPSPTFNGLCGSISHGNYYLTVTNANNCIAYDTVSLLEPEELSYTLASSPEYCSSGQGSATVIVDPNTGTPLFTYAWSDGQSTAFANSLVSGTYSVTVTDANGCNFNETVIVSSDDLTLNDSIIPACNGADDGTATVIATGTPPFSFYWSNGQVDTNTSNNSSTTTNLASTSTYYVVVTDAYCSDTLFITTSQSAYVDLTPDYVSSDDTLSCYGFASSGILVTATGGTGPNTYLYSIPSNGIVNQTTGLFTGLFAGTYSVYVEDGYGCTDSTTINIFEPQELNLYTMTDTSVNCYGGNDGVAGIVPIAGGIGNSLYGGTYPYTFNWFSGNNTTPISTLPYADNLSAGLYSVIITDNNGCTSTGSINIDEPSILQPSTNVLSNSYCSGAQTLASGEIEVSASGATPAYSYLWDNGSTSQSINFLLPGVYTVVVTDANGCSALDSAEVLAGENPVIVNNVENISCFGANDGIITPSATGGETPYQFSSDGGNTFLPSGFSFNNLQENFYFVTVVDAFGCLDTDSIFIVEPDLIEVTNINITNISCYGVNDGQLTPTISGGSTPYSYLWSNGDTNQTATGLFAGNYDLTVTDARGCIALSNASTTEPDILEIISITSDSALCFNDSSGNVYLTGSGGSLPYQYSLNGNPSQSNGTFTDLSAGIYSLFVTDFNGCIVDSLINVYQPNQILITSFVKDSIACKGLSDGWALVSAIGGTGDLSYLWSNGIASDSGYNFSAGYQHISITDENMCVITDSVEIYEPNNQLTIDSIINTEITCFSANNGSIAVYASGGLILEYSKSNGFDTTSQSNNLFSSVAAATYIISVEDNKGCIASETFTLTQPDSLYIDTTIFSHVQCFGLSNGSIDNIVAFGGIGSYQFSVNGGPVYSNTAYFNGYSAGTYTIEVFDDNNCIAQDVIIIDEPPILNVSITPSSWNNYQIRCYGDNSGTADFSIMGGAAPYLKTTTSNGDTVITSIGDTLSSYNSNVTGLAVGVYDFIVEDAYGCIYLENITYNEPDPILHSFVANHVKCDGWNNGSLTDVVSGGVGSPTTYHYLWNTGDTTYSLSNLSTGFYEITVTDENGCSTSAIDTINDDDKLSTEVDLLLTNDVSCFDYCDGEIVLNVTGGIPNITPNGNAIYLYQWNDTLLQTTSTALGLCVNNNTNSTIYTCIISDAQGCYDTISYSLAQPEQLNTTIDLVDPIACFGENSGKIKADAQGGNNSTAYTFSWNNNINTSINDNIIAGNYVVVVTDNKGCSDTAEFVLEEPTSLSVSITSESDVTCFGYDDGEITVTASGGTPEPGIPPTYYYLWDDVDGQTTKTAVNLSPGIYSVTVEDANGCTVNSQTVNISGPTNELVITADSTDETCLLNDGSAQVFVLGGVPNYDFLWNGPNGFTNTNSNISNLNPGSYLVTVTDANGCKVSTTTTVNGVTDIFLPENVSLLDTTICLGTTIILDVQEKPGLFYAWDDGSTNADREISPTEPVNNYFLTIVDPNCLDAYTAEAVVRVSQVENTILNDATKMVGDNPIITLNDQINLQSDNLFDAYLWSNGSSSSSISVQPIESTWYSLMVDSSGCLGIDSIYIVLGVIPYDAITPNGDQMNDVWEILDIENYPAAVVKVFNRWGELVFESNGGDAYTPWDGMFDSEELPVGTYYYVIDLNNGEDAQTGPITIVR